MSKRKPRPRKPRDLRIGEMVGHTTTLDGHGAYAWVEGQSRDIGPRDLRRLAKWALEAAAWIDWKEPTR